MDKYAEAVISRRSVSNGFVPYDLVFSRSEEKIIVLLIMQLFTDVDRYKTAKNFCLLQSKMNFIFMILIFATESSIITKRAKPRMGNDEIFGNHDDDDHNLGWFII